ncbi:Gfo/Idh/MocA family protein [Bacillus litorisediminis]|uniref:Gfo/Idh/MocA family protein n=1 Tax=Bacillus litorisediminis TaxID=2922713 RepID=UPI0028BD3950|nr:Gfo/Idh/MocA family oxidoreductase [Bacillus litorisediminis]
MKKVRWGILSTANIGRTQLIPAIFRAANAEAAAIASRGSKVYGAAEELGIPKAYESYDDLLEDPEVDAVYIPLPNHLHKEWVIKAARKGKHVLCEKPLALDAAEAEEIVQVTKECRVKFMEAFMYQLHPQHDRVREIIRSGEIGDVKLFKSSHSFNLANQDDIRLKKEMGGGAMYDVGCYSIHAIRHVLCSEPIEVFAGAELDPKTGVDLSSFIHVKMENGVTGLFDCSFEMTGRNEYEVVGTKGTIKVPYAFRPDRNGHIGHVVVTTNFGERIEKIEGDIYKLEVEHFSQSVINDTSLIYPGSESIKNMRVIEACYQSIESGCSVKLK